MRDRIIEALDYPRRLIRETVGGRDCPEDSRFDAGSLPCHCCDIRQECQWACCLDEFDDFAGKPDYTLNASLCYGIAMVESLRRRENHDTETCECEACSWLRSSRRLVKEFERSLPPNLYRPAW